jgi:hypothetical protein
MQPSCLLSAAIDVVASFVCRKKMRKFILKDTLNLKAFVLNSLKFMIKLQFSDRCL